MRSIIVICLLSVPFFSCRVTRVPQAIPGYGLAVKAEISKNKAIERSDFVNFTIIDNKNSTTLSLSTDSSSFFYQDSLILKGEERNFRGEIIAYAVLSIPINKARRAELLSNEKWCDLYLLPDNNRPENRYRFSNVYFVKDIPSVFWSVYGHLETPDGRSLEFVSSSDPIPLLVVLAGIAIAGGIGMAALKSKEYDCELSCRRAAAEKDCRSCCQILKEIHWYGTSKRCFVK